MTPVAIEVNSKDHESPYPLSLDRLSVSSGSCSPLALSPMNPKFITQNEFMYMLSPQYDGDSETDCDPVEGLALAPDYTNSATVSTCVSVRTMSTRSRSHSFNMWKSPKMEEEAENNMDKVSVHNVHMEHDHP